MTMVDRSENDEENRTCRFEDEEEPSMNGVKPAVQRQNRWFFGGIALLLVGALVYVLAGTNLIFENGLLDQDGSEASNASQPNNSTELEEESSGAVDIAVESTDTTSDGRKEHVSAKAVQQELPSSAPTSFEDVFDWLVSPVTLQDGKMFQIVGELSHGTNAFTQGLTFADGVLYESTGGRGSSTVRILNPDDGSLVQQIPVDDQYFAEGMTFYDGNLVQLTWTSAIGFVYNATNLGATPVQFSYQTSMSNQGWGITYYEERDEFIVTDGSGNLVFWDAGCWRTGVCSVKRTVGVTRLDGSEARNLNEIEFWRGRVLSNVWTTNEILVINPETGQVEKEYDFTELWTQRNAGAGVLNGISTSAHRDILYFTGKNWAKMFKVRMWA